MSLFGQFDWCIVDEAGQIAQPIALGPLLRVSNTPYHNTLSHIFEPPDEPSLLTLPPPSNHLTLPSPLPTFSYLPLPSVLLPPSPLLTSHYPPSSPPPPP